MRNDQMITEVYNLARIYAPKVCMKMNSKIAAEDLVQDFIVNFMEKDFGSKFNPETTSLKYYVWLGLRNVLVSKFRKSTAATYSKYEVEEEDGTCHNAVSKRLVSVTNEMVKSPDGDMISIFELIDDNRPVNNMFSDMLKEEIIGMVAETKFGYDVEVECFGVKFASTVRSIVALFLNGLTVTEIAEKFEVTAARVGQLLRDAILDLPASLVY